MIEKLEAKLAEVKNGKERAQAQLNAFTGAEQVLLQLIEECRAENKAESEVKPDENVQN